MIYCSQVSDFLGFLLSKPLNSDFQALYLPLMLLGFLLSCLSLWIWRFWRVMTTLPNPNNFSLLYLALFPAQGRQLIALLTICFMLFNQPSCQASSEWAWATLFLAQNLLNWIKWLLKPHRHFSHNFFLLHLPICRFHFLQRNYLLTIICIYCT